MMDLFCYESVRVGLCSARNDIRIPYTDLERYTSSREHTYSHMRFTEAMRKKRFWDVRSANIIDSP